MDVLFQFPGGESVTIPMATAPMQGDRASFKKVPAATEDTRTKDWAVSSVIWNLSDNGVQSVTVSLTEASGISN